MSMHLGIWVRVWARVFVCVRDSSFYFCYIVEGHFTKVEILRSVDPADDTGRGIFPGGMSQEKFDNLLASNLARMYQTPTCRSTRPRYTLAPLRTHITRTRTEYNITVDGSLLIMVDIIIISMAQANYKKKWWSCFLREMPELS